MVTISGAQMHNETGYTTDDITVANLEYLIDNAINHMNLVCGTSISNLSGSPGSVSVTSNQSAVLKPLIVLCMKSYIERGANVSGPVTVTSLLANPEYAVQYELWKESTKYLRGRVFERT